MLSSSILTTGLLQLKSRRMVRSQPRLDDGKRKDEIVAKEFVNRLIGDFGGLGALGDPEELWSAFTTTVLDVAGGCLGTHHRAKKNFVSQGTLDTIDQSRRARPNGRAELFRDDFYENCAVRPQDRYLFIEKLSGRLAQNCGC